MGVLGVGSGSSQYSVCTLLYMNRAMACPQGGLGWQNNDAVQLVARSHTHLLVLGSNPTKTHFWALWSALLRKTLIFHFRAPLSSQESRDFHAASGWRERFGNPRFDLQVLSFPSRSKEPATLIGHFGRKREQKSQKVGSGSRTGDLRHQK